MKKIVKYLTIILGCFIILGAINYCRLKNYKLPILTIIKTDSSKTTYDGLAYRIVRYPNENYPKNVKMDLKDEFKLLFFSQEINSNKYKLMGKIKNIHQVSNFLCKNEKLLYYSFADYNVYSSCINEIIVSDGEYAITLKKYLENNDKGIDYILDNLIKSVSVPYYDGGSRIYSTENIRILKCHRIPSLNQTNLNNKINEDIYIGKSTLSYKNEFCQ